MKAFIGLLIICGTYSTHSATVRVRNENPCIDQENGELIPMPDECSNFYICMDGKEVELSCGPHSHFHLKTLSCIDASLSSCVQVKKNPTILIELKPEKPKATTNMCVGKAIGALVPSKESCNEFYICIGSNPLLKNCQVGFHFSPDSRSCIAAETSTCVDKIKTPEQAAPIGTTIFAETVCLGKPNGAMFPIAGSCSRYVACLQHKAFEQTCGLLHFDPSVRTCIDAVDSTCVEGKVVVDHSASVEKNQKALQKEGPSIGNTDLGRNNTGVFIGNANLSINNTGTVSNANILVASKDVEVGNTDLGSSNTYVVKGGKVIGNNRTIPIHQTGLPVNKKKISKVDLLDIAVSNSGISVNADGVSTANDNDTNIEIGDSNLGAGNTGIFIGNANVDISNSGLMSDVNVVSGTSNAAVGNTNLGYNNSVNVEGIEIEKDNKEVVMATFDEGSTPLCYGVASGTLLPKEGNCNEFITCEDDFAFAGKCPRGLHFNSNAKICDWPEFAGCAEVSQ